MIIQKLNKISKYVILILLITLAILSYIYKYDNCSKCKFEINNTKYSAHSFLKLYFKNCIENQNQSMNDSLLSPSLFQEQMYGKK